MSDELKKPQGIKEIAKLAGVSIGTVDRVIHDRPGVSPKTKAKIDKIIEEVGYDPNPIARRLAGFNTVYKIGVIIPMRNDYNPYWSQHLSGIEQAQKSMNQFGIQIKALFFDQRDVKSFNQSVKEFFDEGYSAAVIVPIFQKEAALFVDECHVRSLPVVCIDTDLQDVDKLSFIGQDAYRSGYMAGKLVGWQLRDMDATIICHVTNANNLHENFNRREKGFRDYLVNEKGLKEEQIISLMTSPDNEGIQEDQLQKALLANDNAKALYIPSTRSFSLLSGLTAQQKEELFIVGYDLIEENIELLEDGTIDILISQKPEQQCYTAITSLYKKIIAKQNPDPVFNIPIDIILKENIQYYMEQNQQLQ